MRRGRNVRPGAWRWAAAAPGILGLLTGAVSAGVGCSDSAQSQQRAGGLEIPPVVDHEPPGYSSQAGTPGTPQIGVPLTHEPNFKKSDYLRMMSHILMSSMDLMVPDEYARTGANNLHLDVTDLSASDAVDPFSGRLRASVADLVLRGVGPEINLTRTYQSESLVGDDGTLDNEVGLGDNRAPAKDGRLTGGARGFPMGVGWNYNFGRLVYSGGQNGTHQLVAGEFPCRVPEQTTEWNPYVVMPGGNVEVLYNAPADANYDFITKSRAKATCLAGPGGGLLVTTADGVKHTFSWRGNEANRYEWGLTRVEDPDGNYVEYTYLPNTQMVSSIHASDGRTVTLTYASHNNQELDPGGYGEKYLLTSVSDGTRTVNFSYQLEAAGTGWLHDKYFLREVNGEEGARWQYEYNLEGARDADGFIYADTGDPGIFSMKKQTGPLGASTAYTYLARNTGRRYQMHHRRTTAVATKALSGPGLASSSWSFQYREPEGSYYEETVVTGPTKRETYKHCGYSQWPRTPGPNEGRCPYMGALHEKEIADLNGNVLQTEHYDWTAQYISPQQEVVATILGYGCGDGQVDADEECDSEDIQSHACGDISILGEPLVGNGLKCTGCRLDYSMCLSPSKCHEPLDEEGNTYWESCQASLQSQTCESVGGTFTSQLNGSSPSVTLSCSWNSCTRYFGSFQQGCYSQIRPRNVIFTESVYADLPLLRAITRDGQTYNTVTSSYDAWGNSGLTSEYRGPTVYTADGIPTNPAAFDGSLSQTVSTYAVDTTGWFLHQRTLERLTEWVRGQPSGIARTFDSRGHVLTESVHGATTAYAYNTDGTLAAKTDPRGKTVTFGNYSHGVPLYQRLPDDVELTQTVDGLGRVTSTTRNGKTSVYAYDNLGRVTALTTPRTDDADLTISYSFSPLRKVTTRGGLVQTEVLDAAGRTLSTTAGGITQTSTYDAEGRVTFKSHPNSTQGTASTYDAMGRLLTTTDTATGATESYTYLADNKVLRTDANSNATTLTYRSFGDPDRRDLMKVEAPLGVTTTMTRLQSGDLDTVVQGGLLRAVQRNTRYQVGAIYDPEVGYTYMTYDAGGNLISRQVNSLTPTTFTYDELNRLTAIDYPGTIPDVVQEYDADSRLVRAATTGSSPSEWTFGYDANGNRTSSILNIEYRTFEFSRTYDGNDNLASLTYPTGFQVDYAPSVLGWPTKVGTLAPSVAYHPNGAVASIEFANGVVQTTTLDASMLPATSKLQGPTGTLQDLSYAFDPAQNLTAIADAANSGENQTFGYDALQRINSATGPWGNGSFTYNARNDLLTKVIGTSSVSCNYSDTTGRISTCLVNGYTAYQGYDSVGDVYKALESSATMEHDAVGRLTNAYTGTAGSFYYYDALGARVKRYDYNPTPRKTTYAVYDGSNLLYELDSTGLRKEYVRLGRQLVATRENAATGDTDGDGITDANELYWGLDPNDPTDAALDPDGDGKTNAEEIGMGASPFVPTAFPTANAGADRVFVACPYSSCSYVNFLDASGSTGAGPLTYEWTPKPGSALCGGWLPTTTPIKTLSCNSVRTENMSDYNAWDWSATMVLTVTDKYGMKDTDEVTFTMLSPTLNEDADGLLDWWEKIHFGDIALQNGSGDPDGDGISNQQEEIELTDPNVPDAPSAITDLGAMGGDGTVTLSWAGSTSATAYNLYYSTSPNVTPATGTAITGVQSPFIHSGRTNGTRYYYVVTAVNAVAETVSNEVSAFTNVLAWNSATTLPVERPARDYWQAGNIRGDRMFVWREVSGTTAYLYARNYSQKSGWGTRQTLFSVTNTEWQPFNVAVAMNDEGVEYVAHKPYYGNSSSRLWRYLPTARPGAAAGWVDLGVIGQSGANFEFSGLVVDSLGRAYTTCSPYMVSSTWPPTWYAWLRVYQFTPGLAMRHLNGPSGHDYLDTLTYATNFPNPPGGPDYFYDVVISIDSQNRLVFAWKERLADTSQTVAAAAYDLRADSWLSATGTIGSGMAMETGASVSENGIATVFAHDTGATSRYGREYDYATNTWTNTDLSGTMTKSGKTTVYSPVANTRIASNLAGDTILVWTENGAPKYRYRPAGGIWGNVGSIGTGMSAGSMMVGVDLHGNATVAWSLGGNVWVWQYDKASGLGAVVDLNPTQTASDAVQSLWVAACGQVEIQWLSNSTPVLATYKPQRVAPTANAGADQSKNEGSVVALSGALSSDADGSVASYNWAQISGPSVSLNGAATVNPSFTAPLVTGSQVLTFQLTVTDNDGQTGTDTVSVTVIDLDAPADTTAPVTTLSSSRSKVAGKWRHAITLTPNETATTWFRSANTGCPVVSGGANTTGWQQYSGPVTVQLNVTTCNFEYYSVDTAQNTEAAKTQVLQ